jgi:Mrp family chromosome partitioning ATPase
MSKIFDALRKAEHEPRSLEVLSEQALAPEKELHPRRMQVFDREFGYLSNAIQSGSPQSKSGRIILVVGCVEREGTTYVGSNLSRVLARDAGLPVLFMDANYHDPSLARTFRVSAKLGLADVYENGRPRDLSTIIEPADTTQLYLLGTGARRIGPAAFFSSSQFGAIIASVRRTFRFVVVDGPPLMKYPDSIHLAAHVDGVVIVVRQKNLKREVIRKGIEMIESVNTPVLGAVLNRRRFAIPSLIYKIFS